MLLLHWNVEEELPAPVASAVEEIRSQADAFIFLSGGASGIEDRDREALLDLFECFEILSARGLRFAVGDGGTRSGIMEAAGRARAASGNAFPLLGVAPEPQAIPSGSWELEPNHSHVLTVTNAPWIEAQTKEGWTSTQGYWGSETAPMYAVFDRLSAGRPSIAVVANGGRIALDEIEENLRQKRRVLIVSGSGRVADAIARALEGQTSLASPSPYAERIHRFREQKELFQVFPMEEGPVKLADRLMEALR